MAKYRISGVWKDYNKVITHYAMHTVTTTGFTQASKMSKTEAVELLNDSKNEAMTWLWDYKNCFWKDGEKVEVVRDYLRTDPDNKVTDNLAHLINYQWI